MTARIYNEKTQRWGAAFILLISVMMGIWLGCSTPQEKYKTLSFFFDGVPNPEAPKHFATTQRAGEEKLVFVAVIRSRHKPYVDRQCDACHRAANGNMMEFDQAWNSCLRCHAKVPGEHARMHGPVAAAGIPGSQPTCRWCHQPHESRELALLKGNPVQVCTQCHDAQLLGPKPVQHQDGTSCVQCHYGHGGTLANAHFLKSDAIRQWPTTGPKSGPARGPATAPATQPETQPFEQFAQRGVAP
ncbi:MAG: cytochrome c3 family protein [Phycisphaerae bacterium]